MKENIKTNINSEIGNSTLGGTVNNMYILDILQEITKITTKETALSVRLPNKNLTAKNSDVVDIDTGEVLFTCQTPAQAAFFASHDPAKSNHKLHSDIEMIQKFQKAFETDNLKDAELYFEGVYYLVRTHLGGETAQQFRESFHQNIKGRSSAYMYLLYNEIPDDPDNIDHDFDSSLNNDNYVDEVRARSDYEETLQGISRLLTKASTDTIGENIHNAIGIAAKKYLKIAEAKELHSQEELLELKNNIKIFGSTCLMPRTVGAI